jgi:hypothetical protein
MYSQKKIQETLDAFAAREGWMPTPHSLDEVNEFKAYINLTVEIGSNSKNSWIESVKPISSKRQKEIKRWVENEQAMCAIDSGYFESRYAYIVNECGTITKFKNRKSQEVLDLIISDLEDRGSSIELLILGSRQSGVFTKVMLKIMHRLLFSPNTHSIVASVTHEKSTLITSFIDKAYDKLPWWLIPIKNNKGKFNNGSGLSVQSTSQKTGLAQGFTPNAVYVTNIESIPNPTRVIEEGLLRAVFSSSNTFLVLHGNKVTENGWFTDAYRSAKEYWPKGFSRLCPVFIPWVVSTDIYPQPDWLKAYPIPNDWKPNDITIEHKKRCENFIRSTPYLSKIMGDHWEMPTEQQWWWEDGYKQAEDRKNLEDFLIRFPPDDGDNKKDVTEDIELDEIFPDSKTIQEKVALARRKEI